MFGGVRTACSILLNKNKTQSNKSSSNKAIERGKEKEGKEKRKEIRQIHNKMPKKGNLNKIENI